MPVLSEDEGSKTQTKNHVLSEVEGSKIVRVFPFLEACLPAGRGGDNK